MKLKDAIREAELSIFNDQQEREAHRTILQAAKDLQTLIEARQKATAGKWVSDVLLGDISIFGGNVDISICRDLQFIKDANFITITANTLEKHTERNNDE